MFFLVHVANLGSRFVNSEIPVRVGFIVNFVSLSVVVLTRVWVPSSKDNVKRGEGYIQSHPTIGMSSMPRVVTSKARQDDLHSSWSVRDTSTLNALTS